MNQIKYLFAIAIAAIILTSCNNDKMYEGEMYKNIFSLLSSGSFNIRELEHDLDKVDEPAYIAVSVGGTTPGKQEIVIQLIEDTQPFDLYNFTNFVFESQYARLLPKRNYKFDGMALKIPVGEKSATLPFQINMDRLSPDSTYFISLKVQEFSHGEINPQKADVLYRPRMFNFWAQTRIATNYRLRGKYNNADIVGSKRVFPLAHNRVRTTMGNTTNFNADTVRINRESIIIEIGEKTRGEKIVLGKKYPVKVMPFRLGTILPPLTEDPEFPNIFFIEDDGYRTFKTFLLHYRFQRHGEATIHVMKEELRLEFLIQK